MASDRQRCLQWRTTKDIRENLCTQTCSEAIQAFEQPGSQAGASDKPLNTATSDPGSDEALPGANAEASDPRRVVPAVIFHRPEDAVEPFAVAKVGFSIFSRVGIREMAVVDSCRFFQRNVVDVLEDLSLSMLAFFSKEGRFNTYARLPPPDEMHGFSSQIIAAVLNLVANKSVPLSWPLPEQASSSGAPMTAKERQQASARNNQRVTTEKSHLRHIWENVLEHSAQEFNNELVDEAITGYTRRS